MAQTQRGAERAVLHLVSNVNVHTHPRPDTALLPVSWLNRPLLF